MITCRFCHRPLKNPKYAAVGVGPVCAKLKGITFPRLARKTRFPKPEKEHPPSPWVDIPLPFNTPQEDQP